METRETKIDKDNRICISAKLRDFLGWSVNDEVKIVASDNKITITRIQDEPEDNVEALEPILDETNEKTEVSDEEIQEVNQIVEKIIEENSVETQNNFYDYYKDNSNDRISEVLKRVSKTETPKEKLKEEVPKKKHWKHGVLKDEITILDKNTEYNDRDLDVLLCPKCGKRIGKSRFKLNGNYICRSCRDDFRDRLILDIQSNKFREEYY